MSNLLTNLLMDLIKTTKANKMTNTSILQLDNHNCKDYAANGYSSLNRQRISDEWAEFSVEQKPTAWMTLTAKEPQGNNNLPWQISNSTLMNKANLLVHFINQDFFNNREKARGEFLEGFGCIEPQRNYQPHIHLAITNKFTPTKLASLESMFINKLKKFTLFNSRGFDFQQVSPSDDHFRGIGSYVAKGGNMLLLSKEGLMT